jgi:DNA-binding NarL/FixJ family response regulator
VGHDEPEVHRAKQVMVVDSQQSFCDAMRVAIDLEPDLECVASAPNAEEALDLLREIDPDVVVVDMTVDGGDPLGLAERILRGHPERSVILMGNPRRAEMQQALRIGVADVILKDQGLDVLLERVRQAEAGKTIDEDTVAEVLLGVSGRRPTSRPGSTTCSSCWATVCHPSRWPCAWASRPTPCAGTSS